MALGGAGIDRPQCEQFSKPLKRMGMKEVVTVGGGWLRE